MFVAYRLESNCIGGYYDKAKFVASTAGIIALCEGLKGSSVTLLECAAATHPKRSPFLSAPVDTPSSRGSLRDNHLCGVSRHGHGTYTTEGITKLCEGLKGSAMTSLRCADAPKRSHFRQRPLTPDLPSQSAQQLAW